MLKLEKASEKGTTKGRRLTKRARRNIAIKTFGGLFVEKSRFQDFHFFHKPTVLSLSFDTFLSDLCLRSVTSFCYAMVASAVFITDLKVSV